MFSLWSDHHNKHKAKKHIMTSGRVKCILVQGILGAALVVGLAMLSKKYYWKCCEKKN